MGSGAKGDPWIELAKGVQGHRQAGRDAGSSRSDGDRRTLLRVDGGLGREVASRAEILAQGDLDEVTPDDLR